ncbi:ATP-dependent RNA helicase suv3, partial [Amanita rubescens]
MSLSITALCCRCRLSLEQPSFLFLQKRFRRKEASYNPKFPPKRTRQSPIQSKLIPSITSSDDIPSFFARNVKAWSLNPRLQLRLRGFGIPTNYARPLLESFVDAVIHGQLSKEAEDWEKYGLARFGQGLRELLPEEAQTEMDIIYSTIFFTWASDPKHQENLIGVLRHQADASNTKALDIMSHIRRLTQVASRRHPAEEYPAARQMRRRIIMHVGPTNSGKTHCALRALAASPSGVYAGPLRLLAHEVWERLNLGEITPLGVDEPPPRRNTESRTSDGLPDYFQSHPNLLRAFDTGKRGNIAHMRPCNLITGEEHRIVANSAPLMSCTVEMLSMRNEYDVAVVDEIQMISDMQRGAGWTSAVLGLCASEIHLCGEETAVPLVQALLHETGDEIEVRRYERLTPLEVEKRSIGDYGNIEKGDCVVAFSRSGIFGIKNKIEERTGMKCAVVYGKLPPEVRSEQARLFNDPSSGYDVIIGSDAIGMGLNLKIRRVVFDAAAKRGDGGMQPLSTSQVKQIAGRAGRYGLLRPSSHESKHNAPGASSPGGYVTTLFQSDLPFVQRALVTPIQPLRYARLGFRIQIFQALANVLPANASTLTIHEAHMYAGRIGDNYRYATPKQDELEAVCKLVDEKDSASLEEADDFQHFGLKELPRGLTIEDRSLFCMAPVAWRDPQCASAMKRLMKMYREMFKVELGPAIKGLGFMEALEGIESLGLASGEEPTTASKRRQQSKGKTGEIGQINQATLTALESFHKVIGIYLWMSFRNPACWGQRQEVSAIKLRVEHALERCLEGLSKVANDRTLQELPIENSGQELSNPVLKKLAVAC